MSSIDPDADAEPAPAPPELPLAVRAQLLATEHWSLLATRGMTWSEVLGRISIHLTVASASLVVLALVTQAAGFGTAFRVLSIGLTSTVLVLGTMTGIRVHNASLDDMAMVIGMNRLRAAYLEMDPTLGRYFVTSWNDDVAGAMRSYTMGNPRHRASHIVGSTSMFMTVTNTIIAGTLGALVADATGGGPPAVSVTGLLVGLAYLGVMVGIGTRSFRQEREDARFPSPAREG